MITYKNIKDKITEQKNRLKNLKKEGQLLAGLFNPLFPASILKGCGYTPFRMSFGATTEAEAKGEKFVRPDSCPFCKTLIGNFSSDDSIHSITDVTIAVNSCDQIRRSAEVVSNSLNRDVLQIQFPVTYTNSSKKYFISELKLIIKALENRSGKDFDINEAFKYHSEQSIASNKMKNLFYSKSYSPKILHNLSILYSISDPFEFNKYIDSITPDLENFESNKTILIIGSPTLLEDDGLISMLEQHNVSAIQLNSTGLKQFLLDENKTNIEKTEEALGNFLLEAFPHIGMRPNNELYKQIQEVADITKADGIIMKSLSFCDLWYTEKVRLKSSFNIPVLTIDTGYGKGSADRIETRIETFLETL